MLQKEILCSECEEVVFIRYGNSAQKFCTDCKHQRKLRRTQVWKQKNRGKVHNYNIGWNNVHKEEIKARNKKYKEDHKEELKEKVKNRRDEINAYRRKYSKKRYAEDLDYKITCILNSRMKGLINGEYRSKTALKLLGCTLEDFRLWIESLFDKNMSWENHGTVWHYDHVIPCALFDQADPDEQEKCWHWSNYQPLFGSENMSKQDKISDVDIETHIHKIDAFIDEYNDEISDEMTLLNYDRVDYANC